MLRITSACFVLLRLCFVTLRLCSVTLGSCLYHFGYASFTSPMTYYTLPVVRYTLLLSRILRHASLNFGYALIYFGLTPAVSNNTTIGNISVYTSNKFCKSIQVLNKIPLKHQKSDNTDCRSTKPLKATGIALDFLEN